MLEHEGGDWLLSIVDAKGAARTSRYFVPLAMAYEDHDEDRMRALSRVAVTKVRQQAEVGVIADAMADEAFCRALVQSIGAGRTVRTEAGRLRFTPGANFAEVVGDALEANTRCTA